jgi:HemY protein
VKQVERLARLAPLNRESMIALGLANLDAKLWGEARRHFTAALEALKGEANAGLCRLMARLEEEEGQNLGAVREWLARAAEAPPDPAWVCEVCGAAHARWQGNCSRCGSFDKLVWRAPARVQPVLVGTETPPPALVPPDETNPRPA